jgi:small subunit ribosomal protein S20
MAHSVSAKKRVRQNVKHRAANRRRKLDFRGMIREFNETIQKGDVAAAEKQLPKLYKKLDQVSAKPAMHKKTAWRYKSRLTMRLNAAKKKTPKSTAA